jgi:hypothetical protein
MLHPVDSTMTIRSLPLLRVRSTENRVLFLEGQIDQLLRDHHEAGQCSECEELLGELINLLDDITSLDSRLHELYYDGLPYSESLTVNIEGLYRRWLKLGTKSNELAVIFEAKGYAIDGITEFRIRCHEVEAIVDPSDELSDGFVKLEAQALQEDALGETLAGLVDG